MATIVNGKDGFAVGFSCGEGFSVFEAVPPCFLFYTASFDRIGERQVSKMVMCWRVVLSTDHGNSIVAVPVHANGCALVQCAFGVERDWRRVLRVFRLVRTKVLRYFVPEFLCSVDSVPAEYAQFRRLRSVVVSMYVSTETHGGEPVSVTSRVAIAPT